MHAHDFGGLHAKQGQGIAVAQVGHVRKGQTADIIKRLDVLAAGNARGGELGAVLGALHGLLHRPSDARELVFGKEIGGKMGKEAGLGIGINNQVNSSLWQDRVVHLPLKPAQTMNIGLAYGKNISPASEGFLHFIEDKLPE